MKTSILILAVALGGATARAPAQTPPPATADTNVVSNTNRLGWRALQVTLPSGEVLASAEVESQLTQLRQNIAETKPVLTALITAYSNSPTAMRNQPGGIAGVLGEILSPTNNPPREPAAPTNNTNAVGRILSDVITGVFGRTNATELQDLAALQTYLQATEPIFDRLGVGTNSFTPSGIGGPQDTGNLETGSGSSTNLPNRLPVPPPRY